MKDSNFIKIKFILAFGFLVAFVVFCCSPLFAFEGLEVEGIPFVYVPASDTYQQFTDVNYPDSPFYSIPRYESSEVGLQTSFPVPYYSDGDHYSVLLNFSFAVPYEAISNNQWVGIYLRPMLSNGYMTNSSSGQWLKVNVLTVNPTGSSGYTDLSSGSFMWQGHSDCSYRMLITCMNDSTIVANQPRVYNVSLVLDLNLKSGTGVIGDELRPFSISARYYLGYPNISSGYGLGLYKDFTIRCTDTSMYGLLENIESAVSSIDFSGLSGLADLNVTVENLYNEYVNNAQLEIELLESILDDGETDEDVTRWGEVASEFNEQNDILHSLENEFIGTIEDFTMPTVVLSDDINLFNRFFDNEIIILLVTISLALAICFCILL